MNVNDMEHRSEIIIYKGEDGQTAIDVRLQDETVWLTQNEMAKLFQRERTVITKHLNNVFATGELVEKSNVQKMHIANDARMNAIPFSIVGLRTWTTKNLRVKSSSIVLRMAKPILM